MLSKGTSKLSDKSWIVKLWKIWTAYVFHLRFFFYFTIPDNAWSFSLALRQVLFVWFSIKWLWKFLAVAAFNDANADSYWNRSIKRKKKTTFRSIYFQIVETELTKHFFSLVISRLFMTSLTVGPHLWGVVSSAKFVKSEL